MRVRTGTTSWAGDEWTDVLYPLGTPPAARLRRCATTIGAVELGSTYFRTPSRSMVRRWASQVPPGFEISARFPRSVCSGDGGRNGPDPRSVLDPEASARDIHEFLSAMLELGAAAGPLLLQVPYLTRSVFPNRKPFVEKLDGFLSTLPPDFRYAVEIRNHRWIGADVLEVLRRHSAALVLLDRVHLPHFDELAKRHDLFPTRFTYLRLLGEGRSGPGPDPTVAGAWVEDRIRRWARLVAKSPTALSAAYVFVDRTYAPDSLAALRDIAALLSGGGSAEATER